MAIMTPQERDLLTTLLTRLKSASGQAKDPDAEALIRQAVAEQPDAPYFLAQTVLIQDLSLHNAQNRIAELERQLGDAQRQAAQPAPTSFLGSLFGLRSTQPAPAPAPSSGSVPPAGPWTRAPQVAAAPPAAPYSQGYGPGGYGPQPGAGGALLFQGIESLFGQHASAGILGNQGATPGLGETVINNYYGEAGANQDFSGGSFDPSSGQDYAGGGDPGGQDFSGGNFDPSGGDLTNQDYGSDQDFGGGQDQDFGGGDFGGGDLNQC